MPARGLDVDEERAAVGAERRAGELVAEAVGAGVADEPVERDVEDLAAAGQAADVVVLGVVLAQDQRPAPAGRDVVGEVERRAAGRLVQELEPLGVRVVGPDLARAVAPAGRIVVARLRRAAALGRGEVDDAVVVDRALEARELRGALGEALPGDVRDRIEVRGRGGLAGRVGERRRGVVDVDPLDVVRRATPLVRRRGSRSAGPSPRASGAGRRCRDGRSPSGWSPGRYRKKPDGIWKSSSVS